ncbi:MAG TPA: translation initiation factor [Puia sp.]|jgi:translation initiation factor 1
MNKKKGPAHSGIVYSTNPDFKMEEEESTPLETPTPKQQKLKVRLDTRQRAGKAVTLVEGFIGKESALEELGKKLKTHCGTGGSVKEGGIIIQGDQRDKVVQWLQNNGFTSSKRI